MRHPLPKSISFFARTQYILPVFYQRGIERGPAKLGLLSQSISSFLQEYQKYNSILQSMQ